MNSKNVTVYCGSRFGNNPAFAAFAGSLGEYMGQNGYTIFYGGGSIGLMGILADAALSAHGKVIGIIPQISIAKEQAHRQITELREVDDMETRKKELISHGHAFIILPGGTGTLEELADTLSYFMIYDEKDPPPIIVANIDHFYDPLNQLLKVYRDNEFMSPSKKNFIHFVSTISEINDILEPYFKKDDARVEN